MWRNFRHLIFYGPGWRRQGGDNAWGDISRSGIKLLLCIGLGLLGTGVLILMFPLVLAVVAAGFLFLGAVWCFQMAGRIFWAGRASRRQSDNHRIHIEIKDVTRDE